MEDRQPLEPVSAARLRAELAFAAPPLPDAAASPQIIVVRRKRHLTPEPVFEQAPQPEESARAPRVFLARTAPVQPSAAAAEPAPQQPTLPGVAEPVETLRPRRAERIGHDKRAKVIRVVVAPETPEAVPSAQVLQLALEGVPAAAAPVFDFKPRQSGSFAEVERKLAAMRAEVQRLRSVAAFIAVEPGFTREWQRIEEQLAALRHELETRPAATFDLTIAR